MKHFTLLVAWAFITLITLITGTSLFAQAQTWAGSINDSTCGARHMIGMAARECTEACVKQGGSYVLVSQRKVYKLEDPEKVVAAHAGHTVNLSGQIKGDTITVTKIEMPPRK